MKKRTILAVFAVFIAWSILGFVIHALILGGSYRATAELWRPRPEMKMGLTHFNTFVSAVIFVFLYGQLVTEKGMKTALMYGLLFGIGVGVPMASGTYASMPIPPGIAAVWFAGTLVETMVGGLIIGWMREPEPDDGTR